jgi:hypothetical protein
MCGVAIGIIMNTCTKGWWHELAAGTCQGKWEMGNR